MATATQAGVQSEVEIETSLEVEQQDLDEITRPFNPEEIKVRTVPMLVDQIVSRVKHNELDLAPDFQRLAGIWDVQRKSRLIESLLLRITGQDVLCEDAESDTVEFDLRRTDVAAPCRLSFRYSVDADQLAANPGDYTRKLRDWSDLPPLGRVLYVSAERLGPRIIYSRSETMAYRGELGTRGEYVLNYLEANRETSLLEGDLRCADSPSRRLPSVVDYWLHDVSPGAHLQFEAIRDANAIIGGFSFDRLGDVPTRRFRSTNVGFGLSYILPVVTALLSPAGTLCMIENPEAHLHPRGQTRLGELAVRAAVSGIQVIAETHSDHFMDGVRIAVRDKLIEPTDTAFHYFERDGSRVIVRSPQIDFDGRLSSWPSGFFDQHEENLAKLLVPIS